MKVVDQASKENVSPWNLSFYSQIDPTGSNLEVLLPE